MSRPIEEIGVTCPACGHYYQDWRRDESYLDDFDEDYLDKCRSATCPQCQHKVSLNDLSFFGSQTLDAIQKMLKMDQNP